MLVFSVIDDSHRRPLTRLPDDDLQLLRPDALHGLDGDRDIAYVDMVANLGNRPKLLIHQSAETVALLGLKIETCVRIQIVERYSCIDDPATRSDLMDRRFFDVVLVLN